jgi:hypothetical protein
MIYNVKKFTMLGVNDLISFEVGKEEVKHIEIDSLEKIIEINYENKKRIKLIPFEGSIDLTLLE